VPQGELIERTVYRRRKRFHPRRLGFHFPDEVVNHEAALPYLLKLQRVIFWR
jgi:hypothetical protein